MDDSDSGRRWPVAWHVGQFTLAGLVAVLIVGMATAIASRRVGEREAIVDARSEAVVQGQGFVEPVVLDSLVDSDPVAVQRIDDVIQPFLIQKPSVVRVKIWAPDGTILYSDKRELMKTKYSLGANERQALTERVAEAEITDLTKPENRYEQGQGKLLEVYLPIRTPTRGLLLFEVYYRYDRVLASGSRVWRDFAPVSLGALVALELVQIPLAWSLARRLRERQREREGLLRRALEASDVERRRVASDLHDGVVQDLAGVAFGLSGAARSPDVGPHAAALLNESATHVRASIKSLRSLLVEIYPPNLHQEGLEAALSDLLARANGRDIQAALDVSLVGEDVPAAAAGLLYRVAQEGIRNVLTHAHAKAVTLHVETANGRAILELTDDGVGFDPLVGDRNARTGHFGLQGLTDLVADAGGRLEVQSAPGAGTRLHVEVPLG